MYTCVCEREGEKGCVCMDAYVRTRVCVLRDACMCVRERERENVCARSRVCSRVHVYACVWRGGGGV